MAQDKNSQHPLLIVSDAISGSSGLARIARDLSTRIHENLSDVYRLGVAGYGGVGSRKFPFPQYHLEGVQADWVLPSLPEIVQDFAGDERCIIFPICDLHRLSWFSQPERLGGETLSKYPGLKDWLLRANVSKWLYCPIDSSGPNDKLSFPIALTALGFDRLLAYGEFGEGVLRRSIGDEEADKRHLCHLPHGVDTSVFHEMPRFMSRKLFFQHTGAQTMLAMLGVNPEIKPIADDEVLVGICATNQARKDFPLALETCAILAKDKKIRVWLHIDRLEANYSIPSLLVDFGLLERSVISLNQISDEHMATAYSACDVTLAPGLGEGMGFPIFESLFSGTPCIHGNYGGAPEWMNNQDLLVEPVAYRYEGSYCSKRPVFSAQDWAEKTAAIIGKRMNYPGELDWSNLWPRWEAWFREAAK
jgi:glycosyltransferase involved in cell wall biosynthesis